MKIENPDMFTVSALLRVPIFSRYVGKICIFTLDLK